MKIHRVEDRIVIDGLYEKYLVVDRSGPFVDLQPGLTGLEIRHIHFADFELSAIVPRGFWRRVCLAWRILWWSR